MLPITEKTVLYTPSFTHYRAGGLSLLLDPDSPNWAAVEARATALLARADGRTPFGRIVADYAASSGLEAGKAWLHVHDFFHEARRAGLVGDQPFERPRYAGRLAYGEPVGLAELWIHTNNSCNLACRHCLVSSGPEGIPGLPVEVIRRAVEQAAALGAGRFYFTGGEPFLRRDLSDLIRWITADLGAELIVLTNATLFAGPGRQGLAGFSRDRVKFQVSVDGARPETNDPLRGAGTFRRALDGVRWLADLGYDIALTTVVTRGNLAELPELPLLARRHGARSQHLMWSHRRGRALLDPDQAFFPESEVILPQVLALADAARQEGIAFDNLESVRRRVDGRRGIKYDLGNAGWDSLCLYADGTVYPSAALAAEGSLAAGWFPRESLADILRDSAILRAFREATVARRPTVSADPLRFLTGGGDIELAYAHSAARRNGRTLPDHLAAPDPYYPIQAALVHRVWEEAVSEAAARINRRSGYDVPRVVRAMGESSIACGAADGTLAVKEVLTLHSNCVLSFDVDKPRRIVRSFYSQAAEVPRADLCCPTTFDAADIAHIPKDVIERFYGCGSPVAAAGPAPGEVYVDLGCGAGIDVFIAARRVGPGGRAIGVDMTGRMLEVARQSLPIVAGHLGYDVVDFREGFLESPPVESRSADIVTSNCVVNLSPDKGRVFGEIWRILKDGGRTVIADIVSDRDVPPDLKTNPELWSECTVGALTEDAFLAGLEKAGFFGIEILGKAYWKSIAGHPFYSLTVRAWKFEKTAACRFVGQRAVYLGPLKAVIDEEGHTFPRGAAVEVCTDTAFKLRTPPYSGRFAILEPGQDAGDIGKPTGCGPEGCC